MPEPCASADDISLRPHTEKNKHAEMKLRINFNPVQRRASYQSNKEPPLVQAGNKAARWACWNWLPGIFVLPLMSDRECNHILWKWSPGSWNGRSEEKVSFISQGAISTLNASRQPVSKDIGDYKEREEVRWVMLVNVLRKSNTGYYSIEILIMWSWERMLKRSGKAILA